MIQIQKGSKYATIASRTFGGYRVFLYNAYFDTQDEVFFESKKEAEEYVEVWISSD